ncbi:MAG: 50S ribosomal protein L24 [Patescibacteria group bacterium]
MKIRKGDKVKIITGKDRGKTGSVVQVFEKTNRVLVEGINIVKRHVKPGVVSKEGGIVNIEKPISVSNVMYWDEKAAKTVRIGYKVVDNKKHRISRETEDVLEVKKK